MRRRPPTRGAYGAPDNIPYERPILDILREKTKEKGMSDLLAYEMPVTRIIEDQSVQSILDAEGERILGQLEKAPRYELPFFRIEAEKFKQTKGVDTMAHMHMDRDRKIKINRCTLVIKLKENLAEHEAIHAEAVEGYRETVQGALATVAERCAELVTGLTVEDAMKFDPTFLIRKLHLQRPQSYAKVYREAIAMFEMDEVDFEELTLGEFRELVLDEWDWQDEFLTNSLGYASESAERKLRRARG